MPPRLLLTRGLRRALVPLLLASAAAAARAVPVDFHLDAPTARSVELAGEMTGWDAGKQPLRRGPDGRWQLTLDLEPGEWVYKFVVDGRWIADPANPRSDADGQGGRHSLRFVGDGDWVVPAGAPRGELRTLSLRSEARGDRRKVHVYLPPGWRADREWPLLLLLHGRGLDADQWRVSGALADYMDAGLARGDWPPFVVVMPSSDTTPYDGASERHVMDEVLPLVRRDFHAGLTRERTAVAGMSMGGRGSVHLAFAHPDRFGLAVPLSGWYPREFLDALPPSPARPVELDIACGTEDPLLPDNRALAARLQAKGVRYRYLESPGGHDWHYWSGRTAAMLRRVGGFFDGR